MSVLLPMKSCVYVSTMMRLFVGPLMIIMVINIQDVPIKIFDNRFDIVFNDHVANIFVN